MLANQIPFRIHVCWLNPIKSHYITFCCWFPHGFFATRWSLCWLRRAWLCSSPTWEETAPWFALLGDGTAPGSSFFPGPKCTNMICIYTYLCIYKNYIYEYIYIYIYTSIYTYTFIHTLSLIRHIYIYIYVLYYITLYYTILYYIILYYTVLYYIILYYTIFYYTIL